MRKYVIGFIFLLASINSLADNLKTTGGTSMPYRLYLEALNEYPEYDPERDYTKLGTISINLANIGITSIKKNLVDKVVVYKSQYKIFLYKGNNLIKSFYISLGKKPKGPKLYEGDQKTPEGIYTLDYIKERSNYYKAFHISYPNSKDIERARKLGKRPGGMIMVHGEPHFYGKQEDRVPGIMPSNWTNGCIALLNADMDEFLSLVDPGTTIEILP